MVLSPVTAIVWDALDDWTTEAHVGAVLAARFPEISGDERSEALAAALALLVGEELLERGGP